MVRLTSSGTVVEREGFVDTFLSLPMKVYQFLMFFFMTLIDVCATAALRASWLQACTFATAPLRPLPRCASTSCLTVVVACMPSQPASAKKAREAASRGGSVRVVRRPMGGVKGLQTDAGACGAGG